MDNKVTFGLEKVHIAFKGIAQVESIAVTNPCELDGEITVTITATTLLGVNSPKAIVVPLASETHDSVAKVASAIVNALNNDAVINTVFIASNSGGVIALKAKVAQDNDNTLDIAVTVGDTGVTVGASTAVTAGAESWGTPVAIPGAIKWAPEPQGDSTTFYADNGAYFIVTANNGYQGDLEMALVPDNILAEMLGWQVDDNGMLVEDAEAIPKEFALLGQIQGDQKNRRFVYYNCTAARPSKEHNTKGESLEPATDALKITISPIEISGKKLVKGTLELSDVNVAAYNAFFNSVYQPIFS